MTDIEIAFNLRFGTANNAPVPKDDSTIADVRQYLFWAMKGRKGDAPVALSSAGDAIASSWLRRFDALVDEARRVGASGEKRDSFAFDSLKQRTMRLADEVCLRSERGIAFGYVAKAFDDAADGRAGEEQVPSMEVWANYPYLDRDEFRLICEIEKYAAWDLRDGKVNLDARCEEFRRRYPRDASIIEMAVANGRLFREVKELAYKLGAQNGKAELDKLQDKSHIPQRWTAILQKEYEKGRLACARSLEARRIAKRDVEVGDGKRCVQHGTAGKDPELAERPGGPNFYSDGTHPNSLLNLKPARRWTIVADESRGSFDNGAFGGQAKAGRYVFVIVPDYARLPELSVGWHATDGVLDEVLAAAEKLHGSECGIIGIPVTGLNQTNRSLWFSCIEALLDMVLRLLPVDGSTEIDLAVEQRGDANEQNEIMLQKTADDAMYHLSLASPGRAKNISLSARFIAKRDSPYNGYADLVSYSLGCGKAVRRMFRRFGWVGPCLVSEDIDEARTFRKCLSIVQQDGTLAANDWNALVTSRIASRAGSLIGALLRAYGEEARADAKRWRVYLDYTLAHLDSKAIRMSLLTPQVAWLKEYEPSTEQMPPRLRLLWLTAQLAASNHVGGTQFGVVEHEQEFSSLIQSLKEEDAPLTCFAALHLAVEKTDAFQFKEAKDMLLPWLDEQAAVPGLRYHAQVLSSIGQHEAFLGNNPAALGLFERAMSEFSRLSADWQRDFDQTCAYAVIAAMDCGSPKLQSLMALYLYGGGWNVETMVDMAQQFASVGEDEPDSKYAHAIFLRYLVALPVNDPIRKAYISSSAKWKWSEDGHPWELIAFYRALLLPDGDSARAEWLRRGYELCLGGGPTLQAIAAVIGAARLGCAGFSKEDYMQKVDEVDSLLPNIGADRIAALRSQADNPLPPLELAVKILPFNFR